MPVVISAGELARIQPAWWPVNSYGSLRFYDQYNYEYAAIYRTQPNVRTCVDFLARNIAQLGLHVFRTVSETDRERLRDHPLAKLIEHPLPAEYKVTRYRLIESLVADLGIYFNAYWLKIRHEGQALGLLRIPPQYVQVKGGLVPTKYEIRLGGSPIEIDPADVVHFRGHNSESAVSGLSPLETLRRVLAEEHAAGDYREHMWRNAARMEGLISRPADAPEWSPSARTRFKAEFEALYSGAENSGRTAILEEGMTWESVQFNAQESQYLQGRKLSREECARAYHIPLPMVGILDHATFSNIEEQHKNLYQDSLGPWLRMVEEDIDLQLLPDFDDREGVYTEFNIQEKLSGSFEEQLQSFQTAVGAPFMTRNEARARMNLPSVEGADRLVVPLNVLIGGQASPRDSGTQNRYAADAGGQKTAELAAIDMKRLDVHNQELRERHEERWRQAFVHHYRRQQDAIVGRIPTAPGKALVDGIWYDEERWNKELQEDLLPLNELTAYTWARIVIGSLKAAVDVDLVEQRMRPWLEEHTRVQAEYINARVGERLGEALQEPEPLDAVRTLFERAMSAWAARQALTAVTAALNFGAMEGARAMGLRTKTWQVNSGNPRPDHAAMNGMSVGIHERFPNGQRWPGDPEGGAEQNANCLCTVRFS